MINLDIKFKNEKERTEATKRKMSEIRKGEKHPFFGKHHTEVSKKKMSETRKGKKHSINTRRKMSQSQTLIREQHWSWKGGINSRNTNIRKSIEFRLWREAVFARDNWTCQKCKNRGGKKINAHHIQSFAQYPELRFAIDNGITFCEQCHKRFHEIYGRTYNNKKQILEYIKIKEKVELLIEELEKEEPKNE